VQGGAAEEAAGKGGAGVSGRFAVTIQSSREVRFMCLGNQTLFTAATAQITAVVVQASSNLDKQVS
jgi:hypothetical protein